MCYTSQAATIICTILTVIVLILIVLWRKCIRRLIAIIKECTKIFKAMPVIVFWPMWSVFLSIGVFAYGLFILYFLVYVWQTVEEKTATVAFHIFGILWILQTIKATVWTSMAGAVAKWFVTANVPNSGKCCKCGFGGAALCASTGMVLAKHLGSMAFGAAVIAICQATPTPCPCPYLSIPTHTYIYLCVYLYSSILLPLCTYTSEPSSQSAR